MRKLGVAAMIVTAAAVAVIVPSGPASAHDGACVGVAFEASVACVRNYHRTVDACDRNADGHWVWAEAYVQDGAGSGGDYWLKVDDTNGSASGCGNKTVGSIYAVLWTRVCVQYEGCGPWLDLGRPHQ